MDNIILEVFPLVAAPRSNALKEAANNGTRYIVASQKVLREIKLPWIEMRHVIAEIDNAIRLPYGECPESLNFLCGTIPEAPIREFIAKARLACPNEMAGAILWNEHTGEWRYADREASEATSEHINYMEVTLNDGEHLVVDVHSHGTYKAFFSYQDNRDDHGTMRLSLVVGNLDRDVPSTIMRLCMAGIYIPVMRKADGQIEVIDHG